MANRRDFLKNFGATVVVAGASVSLVKTAEGFPTTQESQVTSKVPTSFDLIHLNIFYDNRTGILAAFNTNKELQDKFKNLTDFEKTFVVLKINKDIINISKEQQRGITTEEAKNLS